MITEPTHLLTSILPSFSIAKHISKKEIDRISNIVKKTYKGKNKKEFQRLLEKKISDNVQKSMNKEIPPGLILPESHKLDEYYQRLMIIVQLLVDKFKEESLTKQQLCFIINGLVNKCNISEEDFLQTSQRFEQYKQEKFGDSYNDEE